MCWITNYTGIWEGKRTRKLLFGISGVRKTIGNHYVCSGLQKVVWEIYLRCCRPVREDAREIVFRHGHLRIRHLINHHMEAVMALPSTLSPVGIHSSIPCPQCIV